MRTQLNISLIRIGLFSLVCGICCSQLAGQTQEKEIVSKPAEVCARPAEGSAIREPAAWRSKDGTLRVELTFHSERGPNGFTRYCYTDENGQESPTLRVRPGDMLVLKFKNKAVVDTGDAETKGKSAHSTAEHSNDKKSEDDPCAGGPMSAGSTNIHFHGMVVPPTCHQDETIKTLIRPGSAEFEYKIRIPKTEPPGLYWYHPHPHGLSEEQVLGGASGALIVEGVEKFNREAGGLPERVFVIRDQEMPNASAPSLADPNKPTKDLSINYVAVPYPRFPPAVLKTPPGKKEYWRVVNASADTFLDLSLRYGGKVQTIGLVEMDGVPIGYDEQNTNDNVIKTRVLLPPAGRAEFIVTTPAAGVEGMLETLAVPRGPLNDPDLRPGPGGKAGAPGQADQDDNDPLRPLAVIRSSANTPESADVLPKSPDVMESSEAVSLASTRPIRTRKFYFSEQLVDPKNPKGATLFFITEEGHTPKVFDPNDPPDVIVHQGDVEDWIIENRSNEPHTFHIHQTHFLVIQRYGGPYEDVTLRDTINIPFWSGLSRFYPSVRLRMDFRDPGIVGTFPYHCHILQHEDGGMMGTIRVEPAISSKPAETH